MEQKLQELYEGVMRYNNDEYMNAPIIITIAISNILLSTNWTNLASLNFNYIPDTQKLQINMGNLDDLKKFIVSIDDYMTCHLPKVFNYMPITNNNIIDLKLQNQCITRIKPKNGPPKYKYIIHKCVNDTNNINKNITISKMYVDTFDIHKLNTVNTKLIVHFIGLKLAGSQIFPVYEISKIYTIDATNNNNNNTIKLPDILRTNLLNYVFVEHLDLHDLYNLAKLGVNNKIYNLIHNMIISKLVTELKNSIYGYNDFIHILELSNGIISGSFIMHTLQRKKNEFGDYPTYDDIDIFFKNTDDYNIFDKHIQKKNMLCSNYGQVNDYNNLIVNVMCYSRKAPAGHTTKVQCIVLNNIDNHKFVMTTFDMDIVKNILYYKDGLPQIKITNLDYILNQYTNFHYVGYQIHKMNNRITKYYSKRINIDHSYIIQAQKHCCDSNNRNILFTNCYDESYDKLQNASCRDEKINIIMEHSYLMNNNNMVVHSFFQECNSNYCLIDNFGCQFYRSLNYDNNIKSTRLQHYHSTNHHNLMNNNELDIIGPKIDIIHIKESKYKIPYNMDLMSVTNLKTIDVKLSICSPTTSPFVFFKL